MAKDLSWAEAIQEVLRRSGGTLHYSEIADKISEQGLRKSVGATPHMTVASNLSRSLGERASPFLRLGEGFYALKETVQAQSAPGRVQSAAEEVTADTGALRAFGMFWKRDLVVWSGQPKILGRQGPSASPVNFSEQVGVYLLHDRDRVIYVGRAGDTIFGRLKSHTTDRLGGRWDRFSWFGLKGVGEDGNLEAKSLPWDESVVIETMEAVLIESLEPPLNRRRGDNLSASEYLQTPDPAIEQQQAKAILERLARGAGVE